MAREGGRVDINVGVSLRTEIEVYSCTNFCLYVIFTYMYEVGILIIWNWKEQYNLKTFIVTSPLGFTNYVIAILYILLYPPSSILIVKVDYLLPDF